MVRIEEYRRNLVDGLVDVKQLIDHLIASSRDGHYIAEQTADEFRLKADSIVKTAEELLAAEDAEYEDELRRTL